MKGERWKHLAASCNLLPSKCHVTLAYSVNDAELHISIIVDSDEINQRLYDLYLALELTPPGKS